MTKESSYDVVVVGAGPAGSSTAFHLAKKGWSVALFEKSYMPREKACGDGLGSGSVAMLYSMDLRRRLTEYQRVSGVEIRVQGESTCSPSFQHGPAHGLVVPRRELDLLIANRAREVGSDWFDGSRVTGFDFKNGHIEGIQFVKGEPRSAKARFVVIADGGNTNLSSQAGIPRRPQETVGYAIHGYFRNMPKQSSLLSIHLPIKHSGANRVVAGYGWIFPLTGGCANIGVGYYPSQRQDQALNLRQLFTSFLADLVEMEPSMAGMESVGKWTGGVLRSGLDPSCCFANNAMVVGDAAGLVDPFTGEGVDTALVSGQYAAEALDIALKRENEKYLREYSYLLERRYSDRFQLGTRFMKTYSFMWKLVQTSIDQKGFLFDKVREGLFSYSGSELEDTPKEGSALNQFRTCVTEEMKKIATGNFPVFSRLAMRMQDSRFAGLRQALVFWSHQVEGAQPDERLVTVAACLELAKLAHVIQAEVVSGGTSSPWANSFAVMCGNYLLTKSFSAIQPLGHDLTSLVAGAARQLCSQEIQSSLEQEAGGNRTQLAWQIESTFLEAAAQVSTRLAGCTPMTQEQLRAFGNMLGQASSDVQDHARSEPILNGFFRVEAERVLDCLPASKAKRELLMLDWSNLSAA